MSSLYKNNLGQLLIRTEQADVSRLLRSEAKSQSRKRGRPVSPHDLDVQVHVADIILEGVGQALRQKHDEQLRRLFKKHGRV